jgi:hypothetical protein
MLGLSLVLCVVRMKTSGPHVLNRPSHFAELVALASMNLLKSWRQGNHGRPDFR